MNAVITGSNRGIGNAIMHTFAHNKYNIWACARTPSESFESEINQLSKSCGVSIEPVYFDLADENAVKAGVKQIFSYKKSVDVLVNNAGMGHGGTLMMTPVSKLREVYEINVFAQIHMMQLISRAMTRQQSGSIINICSVGGMEVGKGYIAYGSSKAAMIWLTKAAAKELGEFGIRVNGIAPGLTDTEMGHYKSDEEIQKVFDRTVIKRFGKPEEIAQGALYLASDAAAFITGQILVIDGGRVI
ncbi:MAG: SDR family oxidoreductase [Oscillospiraceae bacterium]|nr:SDR family oxidoreductase [Oscillospiraceae bacterium]